MTDRQTTYGTLDQLPRVSRELKVRCCRCNTLAVYDVGGIFCDQEGQGPAARIEFSFTNYFRCAKCNSAGPWDVEDPVKMAASVRAAADGSVKGFYKGRCTLFDGTFIQTPAMGEERLLALIQKAPENAFLHTRLGNLLRTCDQEAKAAALYQKALALDPGDIEARFHLFRFALDAEDVPSVRAHLPPLVRSLLEGRRTNKEDLTRGLAFYVVDELRADPELWQERLAGGFQGASDSKEQVFLRTLLEQEGDEESIAEDAVIRLLSGQPAPAACAPLPDALSSAVEGDLVPSLAQMAHIAGLNVDKLGIAFQADDQKHVRIADRHHLSVSDSRKIVSWEVGSLAELFRGDRQPPADIAHYPREYMPYFIFVELQVLTICQAMGDRTDQEMEEVYTALRRRPDGRSLGQLHDLVWQIAALLLGRHPLSEAEFTAIFGQMAISARKWAQRPVSRNYVAYLRQMFDQAD